MITVKIVEPGHELNGLVGQVVKGNPITGYMVAFDGALELEWFDIDALEIVPTIMLSGEQSFAE